MTQPSSQLLNRTFVNADEQPVPYDGSGITWRVSAYVLIKQADQLLLIKNRLETVHDIIGGGIELGESIEDALHREAQEEGGVTIKIGHLLDARVDWFYHNRGSFHQTMQLFYTAQLVGEIGQPTDPDITWVGFVPLSEVGTKYQLPSAVLKLIPLL